MSTLLLLNVGRHCGSLRKLSAREGRCVTATGSLQKASSFRSPLLGTRLWPPSCQAWCLRLLCCEEVCTSPRGDHMEEQGRSMKRDACLAAPCCSVPLAVPAPAWETLAKPENRLAKPFLSFWPAKSVIDVLLFWATKCWGYLSCSDRNWNWHTRSNRLRGQAVGLSSSPKLTASRQGPKLQVLVSLRHLSRGQCQWLSMYQQLQTGQQV